MIRRNSSGMKKGDLEGKLVALSVPAKDRPPLFGTDSGTFKDGDLLVNKFGIQIISENHAPQASVMGPSDQHLCLADFEPIKVIGKGSGGVVWLVQNKWTQQLFALKVIQLNIEESSRKHIAQELRINQSSKCPYVVICFEAFFENGSISMILEYMDGGSLADFLKMVRIIPEPYLAAICKQVLKGLWYLHHEKHIIHRDLKPQNLLINHRGDVKITDFGVSVILKSTSGAASTFIGTYNYMSPERIAGPRHGYRSDIWSLGLVLLECAAGDFPYSPPQKGQAGWTNVFELMETIVNQPEPRANPDIFSPHFCSFIASCVQKDPKKRLSTNELMKHPFIDMYDDHNIDLASYFAPVSSLLPTL
ncbi:hypothetical protein DM860_004019 [Cuscuta australis]|uniref:mitogen-activated protein kinase kinase n=1 Tax=Cuscuta australis TaxID=267555 RepID=A0A328CV03_9ASTE|nr:hypothetical protein DM860_004019 [Cuscuta australis]